MIDNRFDTPHGMDIIGLKCQYLSILFKRASAFWSGKTQGCEIRRRLPQQRFDACGAP